MANRFSVQPLGGLQNVANIQQGMAGISENVQQDRAAEQQAQAQQAVAQAFESNDPKAIRQAMIQYPEMAEQAKNAFGFTNEQSEQAARETYRRALSDPDNAAQYLQQGIEQVAAVGGRPTNMNMDLQMLQENPEAALQNMRAGYAALASDEEFGAMFPDMSGGGDPAQVRAFRAQAEAAGLEPGTPEYQRAANIALGLQPRAGMSAQERIALDPQRTTAVAGAERQIRGEGRRGELEARREMEPGLAAETKAAEQSIKKSEEAFDQLASIRPAIANLDEAIQLIDEGAGTGPVMSRLPSVREASVKLDNLQGRLGLDVIGNTTFGALSESELQFALSTALPQNLEGPALKEWLQKKKQSQEKLASYLEDAAMFLGRPGNTVADFLERQKERSGGGGQSEAVNWSDL